MSMRSDSHSSGALRAKKFPEDGSIEQIEVVWMGILCLRRSFKAICISVKTPKALSPRNMIKKEKSERKVSMVETILRV